MTKKKSKKTLRVRLAKQMTGLGARPLLVVSFVGAFMVFGSVIALHALADSTAGTVGVLASGLKNGSGQVMCMDSYRNGSTVGTPINIYPCNKSDAAQKFTPYSDQTIRINGKCVGVSGNSNANGAKLVLANCSTSNYMKWRRHTDPRNSLNDLVSVANNKCVDVFSSQTANNSGVNIWDCDDTDAQVWGWVTGSATIATGGSLHNANCDYIGGRQYPDGCYVHLGANQANNHNFSAQGVQADLLQANPVCGTGCGHSIVEIFAGDAAGKNSVEIASSVEAGGTKPTLGIGLWANGNALDAKANFVSQSSTIKPGSPLPVGAKATYKIWYNSATGRVNLYLGGTWLGYFPQSIWSSRGTTFTSIGFAQLYGEAVQPTLNVGHFTMGTGVLGGQAGAATVSNYQLIGSNTPAQLTNYFQESKSQYYSVGNQTDTGFSYGGPGIF
jgi:hypothetical protein